MQKGMIITFVHCLGNVAQVASHLGWPLSTIKSFLRRAYERISMDNIHCPYHPRMSSGHQLGTIGGDAKSNCQTTRTPFRDKYAPRATLATGRQSD